MKTKLLIFFLLLGSICQGQDLTKAFADVLDGIIDNQRELTKILDRVTDDIMRIDKTLGYNALHFELLEKRIAELEKKLSRLEQKAISDSLYYLRLIQMGNVEHIGTYDIIDTKPDTIWIDSELDYFNGTVPVIMLRKSR